MFSVVSVFVDSFKAHSLTCPTPDFPGYSIQQSHAERRYAESIKIIKKNREQLKKNYNQNLPEGRAQQKLADYPLLVDECSPPPCPP